MEQQWVKHLDGFSCHILIYNVCELHICARCLHGNWYFAFDKSSFPDCFQAKLQSQKRFALPCDRELVSQHVSLHSSFAFLCQHCQEDKWQYTCLLQLKMNRYLFFLFKVINGREFAKDSVVRKYNVIPDLSIYPVKAPRVFTVARSI